MLVERRIFVYYRVDLLETTEGREWLAPFSERVIRAKEGGARTRATCLKQCGIHSNLSCGRDVDPMD